MKYANIKFVSNMIMLKKFLLIELLFNSKEKNIVQRK